MKLRSVLAIAAVGVVTAGTSRADFKYTQQSKVTGGALAGVTKSLGVFSKSARQMNEPQNSTTMVRGNRMRTEQSTGEVEIIDLDGRRIVHIDPAKKTYSVVTFDQIKQQVEQAQAKAKEEQTKSVPKNDDKQSVTMVPKFDMQATGQTGTVMNLPVKEIKMRIDMLFQSTDPKTQADLEKSKSSIWMTGDSWYGTIPGYEEVRQFYVKMAKEVNWLPGSMGMSNAQMGQAAAELRKNAVKVDGMPLVQFTSFGLASNGQTGQGAGQDSAGQPPQNQNSSNDSTPTSPKEALAKGIGGLFGKKKEKQQQNEAAKDPNAIPAPAPIPGSMMDMKIEVLSYSKESLDASLFEIPAGYTQVQADTKTENAK